MLEKIEEGKRERGKKRSMERGKEGERQRRGKARQIPGGTVDSALKKQAFSNLNAYTSQSISTADSVPA